MVRGKRGGHVGSLLPVGDGVVGHSGFTVLLERYLEISKSVMKSDCKLRNGSPSLLKDMVLWTVSI